MSSKSAAVEDSILKLCREHPEGLTDALLASKLPTIPLQTRAVAINGLLSKHRLQILQNPVDDTLVYKEIKTEDALKFKGLGPEDMLVYQHIQQAGNMGIWTRDLRSKTNLQQPQINKILKTLDSRSLVKSVKSVANANRKVYMLFELEPARDLTGGAWYTDHDFDKEFIEVLQRACHQFILSTGQASLEEVAHFIRTKVIGECKDGGVISPSTCIYFDQWLQF